MVSVTLRPKTFMRLNKRRIELYHNQKEDDFKSVTHFSWDYIINSLLDEKEVEENGNR
jgi:hypothetical protein